MRSTFIIDGLIMEAVVGTLQYYSLFKYPLKAEEIYGSLSRACPLSSLLVALEDLHELGKIYQHDGYYSLDPDVLQQVAKRKQANFYASTLKRKAMKMGRLIYNFPFVRFVGISGSLSKGYADEKSDFDFFIVTEKNKLWICRTILHLFKKFTFLVGQQHKFCMNYFVDTEHTEIREKNRFTAVELSSLIPVCGYATYTRLEKSNAWTKNHFPNGFVSFHSSIDIIQDNTIPLKNLAEYCLNGMNPDKLNITLMNLTDRKWRKKWARKNYPMSEYDIAFKTTPHVSKNHPANHQKKVLEALAKIDK